MKDLTAVAVRGRPDRFEGFATLPAPAPEAALTSPKERIAHGNWNHLFRHDDAPVWPGAQP